jgi:surface-anchored protein
MVFKMPCHALTTLSTGHVDIFEVHYNQTVNPAEFALHIHDHATGTHFEPADVLIQVNENTRFNSPGALSQVLGAEAYILPATMEDGMLYGGVASGGPTGVFQNNRFSIRMVSAKPENPGNFVLYRFAGGGSLQVGLQAEGGVVTTGEFTVPLNGHEHWNWGFSAPGIYVFEFRGMGTRAIDLSVLETPTELFTFQVIPEPASGALVLAGMGAGWMMKRRRRTRK